MIIIIGNFLLLFTPFMMLTFTDYLDRLRGVAWFIAVLSCSTFTLIIVIVTCFIAQRRISFFYPFRMQKKRFGQNFSCDDFYVGARKGRSIFLGPPLSEGTEVRENLLARTGQGQYRRIAISSKLKKGLSGRPLSSMNPRSSLLETVKENESEEKVVNNNNVNEKNDQK